MAERKTTTTTTRTTAPKRATRTAQTDRVDEDRIAARAYELYVARGGQHGHDVEDWLTAEKDLRGN